jgi:hypothetical protein
MVNPYKTISAAIRSVTLFLQELPGDQTTDVKRDRNDGPLLS